ncbi:DUF1651 domain-containing protein [Prochlorococcus sp. AH-716-K03]|nr:DUF1651 domain-containing protein [Prochlorococcus sp. AH-716-K03]
MSRRNSNVWSNFSFGSCVDTPNDYLLNPEGIRLIFFERCKKSPNNSIKIFTHLFYTNHLGEPAGLKTTSEIEPSHVWVQWNELQEHGWKEVSYNFG